jgi:hypothetical protein
MLFRFTLFERCRLQRAKINAVIFIEVTKRFQRAMNEDGIVIARLADKPDNTLRLAEGVNTDKVSPVRKLFQAFQKGVDLAFIIGVAKNGEGKGRL